MDEAAMKSAQVGNYALMLCEIYGYTYDLSQVTRQATTTPGIRIVDMAMTVPIRDHFDRLEDSDFAVTSFGAGKCMYAGWGGMGFTRDKVLADKVRRMRESSVSPCTLLLLFKRSFKIIAKNLFNAPIAYGFLKRMRDVKRSMWQNSDPESLVSMIYSVSQQPVSRQWYLPTTYVDRSLMLYNLEHIEQYCEYKKTLARRYHDNFDGVPGIIRPDSSLYALSHYPIRVESGIRPLLKKYLSKSGIDVGALYFFPTCLSESDYPNTSRITCEVLDLPLYVRLSLGDIDWICESVACGLERLSKAST
jgi:dTDP-4-amino-4,6-dideoxygalactose transaminase